MSHLSVFQLYCCGVKKNCVCAFHPSTNSLGNPDYFIAKGFYLKWSVFCDFYEMSVFHGYSRVFINYCIFHYGQIELMCHWLDLSSRFYLIQLSIKVGVSFT